jgi:hypothetical protein
MPAYPKNFFRGYSDAERPLVFYAEGPGYKREEVLTLEAGLLLLQTMVVLGDSGTYRVIDSRGKVHKTVNHIPR